MLKLLAAILLCTACSSTSSAPPVPTGIACDEGHTCPEQQPCLYVSALGRHCCGGVACKADFFSCSTSAECGADRKCEGGGCVPCETAGCQEVGDAGTSDMPTVANGCRGGVGFQISPNAVACPGAFTSDPSSQCAGGWSVCTTNPMTAQQCAASRPFGVQGCYIGDARGAENMLPTTSQMRGAWNGAAAGDYRFLMGCGACVGWGTAYIKVGGFENNIIASDMSATPYAYHSPVSTPGKDSDWPQTRNDDPNSGVLCCKN